MGIDQTGRLLNLVSAVLEISVALSKLLRNGLIPLRQRFLSYLDTHLVHTPVFNDTFIWNKGEKDS